MEEGDRQTQVNWVAAGGITSKKGLWLAVMEAAGSLLNVEGSLGVCYSSRVDMQIMLLNFKRWVALKKVTLHALNVEQCSAAMGVESSVE